MQIFAVTCMLAIEEEHQTFDTASKTRDAFYLKLQAAMLQCIKSSIKNMSFVFTFPQVASLYR